MTLHDLRDDQVRALREISRYHVTNHNVNHFYNGVSIAPRRDQDFFARGNRLCIHSQL